MAKVFRIMLVCAVAGLLVACGSNGGTGFLNSPASTMSGTAATGRALGNAAVTIIDSNAATKTTITSATGSYSINITGLTAPFVIKVDAGPGRVLYSFASGSGIANINPFSDLIVRSACGGANSETSHSVIRGNIVSAIAQLKSKFATMLTMYGVPTDYDPLSSSYSIGNSLDRLFDAITVTIATNGASVTITNSTTGGTIYSASITASGAFNGTVTDANISPPSGTHDFWSAIALSGAPEYTAKKPLAVWTGTEVIIWNGPDHVSPGSGLHRYSGRYNPATRSWRTISGTNAPSLDGYSACAVWSGTEMVVWGATYGGTTATYSGARYNPATDSWQPVSTANAPQTYNGGVWTGSEMIVWGSDSSNAGARYNPRTDTWTAMTTANAPTGRSSYGYAWTGTEFVIWGGHNPGGTNFYSNNTGGRYNPATDTWRPITTTNGPSGRSYPTAFLTSDNKVILWGGFDGTWLSEGWKYDPGNDSWSIISDVGAPPAFSTLMNRGYVSIGTGNEMIIWDAYTANYSSTFTFNGYKYTYATGIWSTISTANAPAMMSYDAIAVWTGSQVFFFGWSPNNTYGGGLYTP
ncbi:Kelch-like protein 9 [Geobacter sp. OR-1]|uniref:Kelch repeat-containing protein n=1 Tax=Geobacter sp. OR-1 TaxID=1266765 RepID=UPI0005437360|nr:hypothetical protein [Geobacter sp. OR-1]GAM09146.1 Kelch-like protein 9 [Geobacter sp. OR-1]